MTLSLCHSPVALKASGRSVSLLLRIQCVPATLGHVHPAWKGGFIWTRKVTVLETSRTEFPPASDMGIPWRAAIGKQNMLLWDAGGVAQALQSGPSGSSPEHRRQTSLSLLGP